MITRDDYMSGRATHAEYYSEIARACNISHDDSPLLPRVIFLLQVGDEYLNRIPLGNWDSLSHGTQHLVGPEIARRGGVGWSLADGVCVHKQAAVNAALAFPFETVVDGFWDAAQFAEQDDDGPKWSEVSMSAYKASRLRCAHFFTNIYDLRDNKRFGARMVTEAMRQIRGNPLAAGHDLLLTINGHGAGFWDGDWDEEAPDVEIGNLLTSATYGVGPCGFYVGDDGVLYISGSENA